MTSLRHLRSDTANKRPDPVALTSGQLAINYEAGSPGLFFKDTDGNLVKAGPVHIGTSAPNATPAAGGSAGNAKGEFWLDTTGGAYDLKIWSGAAWVSTSGEYVNITGDTMTGNLTLDNCNLVFEGSTADSFETTLTVVDPTADNTITLPNVSGTVVTTGDTGTVTSTMIADATIVDADISASAEIAVSKLADGSARQLLQTDAAGTGVEWTNNVDIPGTLDVTGAAVFDSTANIAGNLTVDTNTLFVDAANNRVGIGTTSPTVNLEVQGTAGLGIDIRGRSSDNATQIRLRDNAGTASNAYLFANGTSASELGSTTDLAFKVNSTERARIDSSGRLLVGYSTSLSDTDLLQISGSNYPGIGIYSFGTTTNADFGLKNARGTQSSPSVVSSGDSLGAVNFLGYDGSLYRVGGRIQAFVDGTPGANDMPGRLVFSTTADGASSPTERMRIINNGAVLIGNTTQFSITSSTATGSVFGSDGTQVTFASAQTVAYFGRQTSDGTIIEFRQAGSAEGSISVSGTTVSYNGAHLSRWSQLPSGAERTEILRGTVLSNIDEMCEWGDEENEQLNRMKVSDVEGDKNVSGVFQAWDDDDDTYTNDFYCAMTGDFIIRIGAGVTVERGDLLMSAGDGTAKPQDDDIIRSKTIAKVTSTNVSCTYDDGSYCVPCVLMAC